MIQYMTIVFDVNDERIALAAAGRGGKLELQLEELEASAAEDVAAEPMAADATAVCSFIRKRPVRAPLPAHLPRQRVVVPRPSACPCCGGQLVKLGEDVTETLEVVPRQWNDPDRAREV
jgi:hypothetical protein